MAAPAAVERLEPIPPTPATPAVPVRRSPALPGEGWIPSEVPPTHQPWGAGEITRAGIFLVAFLAAHILVSAYVGGSVIGRLIDTAVYGFIAAVSMVLLGVVRWQTKDSTRIVVAVVLAGAVFAAMAVGGSLAATVFTLFLLLLPLWTVIVVTGTGRFRWTATQFTGATLILIATWRPLYTSFPDLTSISAGTSGVLPAYTVRQLYQIVSLKLFHESVFALAGIFLLFGRFPFLQKRPVAGDAHKVFAALRGHSRHPLWMTLGFGAVTFVVALFGSVLVSNLLSGTSVGQGGTDDSHVFERITPDLVLLLSFAAGLGEELLFRAILLPAFERAFGKVFPRWTSIPLAIVAQAALFGVVHAGYGNISHVILPFAFGLLAGVSYRLWGFVPVVYAHTMIDVIAFGSDAARTRPWLDYVLGTAIWLNLIVAVATAVFALVQTLQGRSRGRMATPAEGPLEDPIRR